MVPCDGNDPPTFALSRRCSTTELTRNKLKLVHLLRFELNSGTWKAPVLNHIDDRCIEMVLPVGFEPTLLLSLFLLTRQVQSASYAKGAYKSGQGTWGRTKTEGFQNQLATTRLLPCNVCDAWDYRGLPNPRQVLVEYDRVFTCSAKISCISFRPVCTYSHPIKHWCASRDSNPENLASKASTYTNSVTDAKSEAFTPANQTRRWLICLKSRLEDFYLAGTVGIEPTTWTLTVSYSSNWATCQLTISSTKKFSLYQLQVEPITGRQLAFAFFFC